ncbi:hypothetical protein DPMN_194826 [Dreissena polymorpha]|uniref:Uncharacterized protein n=1 Tax=Dreissena polymorpha TaxID=45954 RepID=A0A9D3Y3J1_DREPO|nr:hypothetical protein DPMN_194826 [Dreissena polymorpha]
MTPLLTIDSPNPGYRRLTPTRGRTLIIVDDYGCVRGKRVFPIRDGLIHHRKWMGQIGSFASPHSRRSRVRLYAIGSGSKPWRPTEYEETRRVREDKS